MNRITTAISIIATLVGLAAMSPGASAQSDFTVGSLPPEPGLGLRTNTDAEPGMAVAPDGSLWATAFAGVDDPRRGTGGVLPREQDPLEDQANADVWVSRDGGRSYRWVAAPFSALRGRPGPGGDDVDIAVASERNRGGHYNIYVATLWLASFSETAFVGDISLAVSQDDGRTWIVDPFAATVPLDDRPWLAADGACGLYLAHHGLPTATVTVEHYDLCNAANLARGTTVDTLASTRLASFAPDLVSGKPGVYVLGSFGKPVVDTARRSAFRHRVYLPAVDCPPQTLSQDVPRAAAPEQRCEGSHSEVYLETSGDGGRHWTLRPVVPSPSPRVAIWAITAAVDRAGTLYLVWFDHSAAYIVASHDGGRTWTPRQEIDTGSVQGVAFPTVAAGGPGDIRIALDGTTRAGDPSDVAAMGRPGSSGAAQWSLYAMRSDDGGRTFSEPVAIAPVHTGKVCIEGESEPGCDIFGDARSMWETLGVAVSPKTDDTAIVYTSDQPGGGDAHDHVDFAAGR